jgi:hypothetical protein
VGTLDFGRYKILLLFIGSTACELEWTRTPESVHASIRSEYSTALATIEKNVASAMS